MNTALQWVARPTVRVAGLAAGMVLLLSACGEPVQEGDAPAQSGSLTPPAAIVQLA